MTLYREPPYETPLVRALGWACLGVWWLVCWLVRGSAYGIGSCLQGQLRVPMEGWRIIGREAAYQYHNGEPLVVAAPVIFIVCYVLALIVW